MPYGTIKVDTVTFTASGVDTSVSVSGLVQNPVFSGNVTSTSTISGSTIRGTTVSGATVTGTAGQFGTLTGSTAGFTTITGTTVTGTTANFVSGVFTTQVSGATILGPTHTGTTANFVSGVFTTQISGATITGTAGQFGTLTGNTAGFTTVTGTTVTGTTANFVSGVFTTQISGTTITGNTAQFTTLTGGTAGFTTVTGATVTGTTANFATLSGATVTGNAGSFTTVTGGVATITSGVFAVGTEALPSISFASDPNTGIFSPGADQVALATNGTRRLLVDSTGALTLDTGDATIYGVRVGRGAGAISTNTAIGASCLNANTTGSQNTAVGNLALTTNTTGQYNTAIGVAALNTNNGNNNTAVGRVALYFNSSGGNNVAVGLEALYSNTIGGNNVCIGYAAGNNLTTGSNNTIIGSIAGTAGLSDTVIIGAGSTERLRIDSSGRCGIGNSSPSDALHVEGTIRTSSSGSNAQFANNYLRSNQAGTFYFDQNSGGQNFQFRVSNVTNLDTTALTITSAGRLGIGTSSPASILHLKGSNAVSKVQSSVNTGYSGVEFDRAANDTHFAIYAYDSSHATQANNVQFYGYQSGRLDFHTNSNASPRLSIASGGNVGIGNSSPSYLVDASGSATIGIRYKSTGIYGSIVADNSNTTGGGFFNAYQNGKIGRALV